MMALRLTHQKGKLLGQGAFGEVYLLDGRDLGSLGDFRSDKKYILKVDKPGMAEKLEFLEFKGEDPVLRKEEIDDERRAGVHENITTSIAYSCAEHMKGVTQEFGGELNLWDFGALLKTAYLKRVVNTAEYWGGLPAPGTPGPERTPPTFTERTSSIRTSRA
jgi:hypothetical protein